MPEYVENPISRNWSNVRILTSTATYIYIYIYIIIMYIYIYIYIYIWTTYHGIMSTILQYHQMLLYIRTCSVTMLVLDDVMMLPHNVMA